MTKRILNPKRQVFLGQELTQAWDYSEATAKEVDEAVKKILSQAHETTDKILKEHLTSMNKIVEHLMEAEEIPDTDIEKLIKNS